ncbi:MAG: DUF4430 domain-containing protein [Lachnospiraceae bacterium]|nr:DUF4430 domain-containing protein [Ruminococcus sp.]MCM1274821.1 DUF4430 domain-containing protein [Lachnospiraceae bacterium]
MKKAKILAAFAAVATAAATSLSAFAAPAEKGVVYFAAVKSTIGQGVCVEPTAVPFYEGESGLDVVKRAAEVTVEESDYGAYIKAFKDADSGADIPEEIKAVCPEMTGRSVEGQLSEYDYTSESGWSYFLNGEYAQVGISGYEPADGDVIEFAFTVYGYGSDLGLDNSSWGGAAALVPAVNAAELIKTAAEADKTLAGYKAAVEVLGKFGAEQRELDAAVEALKGAPAEPETSSNANNANNVDTGVESVAVVFGAAVLAAGALAVSRRRG